MPLRAYFVIHANIVTSPTENQWNTLLSTTKNKPMANKIRSVATSAPNFITATKRNLGTNTNKYTLCIFQLEDQYQDEALAFLNTQADNRGIVGTTREKFAGVLQAELREAATDLGTPYSTMAGQLTVTLINAAIANTFDVPIAIQQVQAYLAANAAIWYAA